jgi:hypothetical protein
MYIRTYVLTPVLEPGPTMSANMWLLHTCTVLLVQTNIKIYTYQYIHTYTHMYIRNAPYSPVLVNLVQQYHMLHVLLTYYYYTHVILISYIHTCNNIKHT